MQKKLISRFTAAIALSLTAVSFAPVAASAQLPIKFGASAGLSSPAGKLSDYTNSGYNVTVLSELSIPLLPIGARLEGSLNHFTWDRDQVMGLNGGARSLSVNANAIVNLPSTVLLQFYGIGGVGMYRVTNAVEIAGGTFEKKSESKAGFNAGVGIRLPVGPIAGFMEVRYHTVSGSNGFNFVPITLGIRF